MNCPECKANENRVIDSRPERTEIKRRRACLKCNHRWNTYERHEDAWEHLTEANKALDVTLDAAHEFLIKSGKYENTTDIGDC